MRSSARALRENATAIGVIVTALAAAAALVFSAQQARSTSEQVRILEQGQFTDRFSRSIQQLADGDIGVRVGAILALGRLARDSVADQPAVMDVLTSYVRSKVSRSDSPTCGYADAKFASLDEASRILGGEVRELPLDLRTGFRVLSERDRTVSPRIDLSNLCFGPYRLYDVDLSGANLADTIFSGSAVLNSDFSDADVTGTQFVYSNLVGNNFDRSIGGANFTYSYVVGCTFKQSRFAVSRSYWRESRIAGLDFTDAGVTKEDLELASPRDLSFAGVVGVLSQ